MSTVIESIVEEPQVPEPKRGCNAEWCRRYRQTEKGKAAVARAVAVRRERRRLAKLEAVNQPN